MYRYFRLKSSTYECPENYKLEMTTMDEAVEFD